jgi:hypothetical protein
VSAPAAVYRSRNPQDSDYYRCVEDYFETFLQIYDEHFSRQYGFWRPYVEQVIYHYLDCGNRGEQMVRYYGYYSNVSRGKRRQEGLDGAILFILEPQGNVKAFRKSWARLIQKIYEVDPLVCPKCQGAMRIISFIEDQSVIRDILNHLELWLAKARPPPKARAQWGHDAASCPHECAAVDLQLQAHADTIYGDPE